MKNNPPNVYALWCTHEYAKDHFDLKLVGIYSDESKAEEAKSRALEELGFCKPPSRLSIARVEVDKDIWPFGRPISN